MSDSGLRFTLDTDILVYSLDSKAGRRRATAGQVIERAMRCDCWLTLQAISEFYSAVTRKGIVRTADAAAQGRDWLDLFPTLAASPTAVRSGLAAAAAGRLSYWDALLLATAAEGGCQAVLTEDLADGAVTEGVCVINPFDAQGGLSIAARRVLALSTDEGRPGRA